MSADESGRATAQRSRVTYNSPVPKRARLGDVNLPRRYVAPPIVQAKLGEEQLFLAIRVECADADDKHSHESACTPEQLDALCVARIGWATGSAGELRFSKERVVQAGDETAEEGISIEAVLNELLADTLEIAMQGGRLLSENLTFHGCLIERELARCSMTALRLQWGAMMRAGLSLKDPVLVSWLQESHNQELNEEDILRFLLPENMAHMAPMEHAVAILKAVRALNALTVPPCRRPGGRHKAKRIFGCSMRDNGEYSETCLECGQAL